MLSLFQFLEFRILKGKLYLIVISSENKPCNDVLLTHGPAVLIIPQKE